ncbi:MAG: 23S rRNA (uracil(1939)-C(5))-methyltransferase RlmD [Steroidobacteraceae bacterium]
MARRLSADRPPALQEADVVGLTTDGRGVARIDGKTVFIAGALPGETVRIRLLKRRRHLDEAELAGITLRSAERVEPRCAHFGTCGGCSLQHLSPAAQLAIKQAQLLDNLERIGRVTPARILEPLAGPPWAYRRRARLGVRFVRKKGRVLAGFREREKPYIADIHRCEVLIEPLASLPEELAALVETLSLREQIPQVEVAAGDDAVALTIRVLAEPTADDLDRLEAFAIRRKVQVHLQSGGIDTIRPLRADYPPLRYELGFADVAIEFGPADFIQINAGINAATVQAAAEQLQAGAGDTVLDLFCGVGNFTLPLARCARYVVGIEGDAALTLAARANALRNHIENLEFHAENLFEPGRLGPWSQDRYDRLLLDPPRAGAREVMALIPQWRPRRVVYISCHPGTLARDAAILVEQHRFRLIAAGVMDMFPHTTHVESMAVFESDA